VDIAVPAEIVAYTNKNNSRQTLIDQALRQYCVTTTKDDKPTTDCNLFIDGRARITSKYNAYFAKYEQYYIKAAIRDGAQIAYDKAVDTETTAQASYNQLLNVNTSFPKPGGTEVPPSIGGEAILQRADAKGGSK
jgi:hypothetical protein